MKKWIVQVAVVACLAASHAQANAQQAVADQQFTVWLRQSDAPAPLNLRSDSVRPVGFFDAPTDAPQPLVDTSPIKPVQAGGADAACCGLWTEGSGRLLDNLSVFMGLDGAKQPQDLGVNANFGGRASVNLGIPIWQQIGLGAQIGSASVWSENAVRVVKPLEGTGSRYQNFNTVGLFQRTDWGLVWGLGYDFLAERYYDTFFLSQWRGSLGYCTSASNEFGVWLTQRSDSDNGTFAGTGVTLTPINQTNVYWRHTWWNSAQTTVWAGVANHHGTIVWVFPNTPPSEHPFVFGSELNIPLSKYVSLFGQANFITPASTGTVDAFLGFTIHPAGNSRSAATNRYAPVLPLAGSPTFAVDLAR
jgi:hypothetical protein